MNHLNPRSLLQLLWFIALALSPLLTSSAVADESNTIKLGWDAVVEPGIQGYRVYVGTASHQYIQSYEAGPNTELTIPGLVSGATYFFAVKTIGSWGLESAYSEEIAVTISTPPLPAGGEMTMIGEGKLALNWSFPTAAMSSEPEFIIEQSADLVNWTVAATISPSVSTGGTPEMARFSWPIAVSGSRKFYRLTARNWLGTSTGP
jgi:hypothetical protein